jgi:mannose-1-phosphate guanylyltransferase
MRAVILAGGEGTRLRPLTYRTPKSLLPVGNRPFLEHQLAWMARHGVTEAMLLTGYMAEAFGPFAAEMASHGIALQIVREASPLGTCGAVRNVLEKLQGTTMVFNGDVLTDLDLTAILEFHRARESAVTIALKPVADAGPYGLVRTEKDGRVLEFLEKPPPEVSSAGGPINAGTYILEPEVLGGVPAGVAWSFERQLFPSLIVHGVSVYGFTSEDYWLDIGTPERYLQAHWDLLEGTVAAEPLGTVQTTPGGHLALLAPGARIEPAASITGPVSLGPGAWIGGEAGRCVLLEDARIEAGGRAQGSILGPGAVVASGASARGVIVAE